MAKALFPYIRYRSNQTADRDQDFWPNGEAGKYFKGARGNFGNILGSFLPKDKDTGERSIDILGGITNILLCAVNIGFAVAYGTVVTIANTLITGANVVNYLITGGRETDLENTAGKTPKVNLTERDKKENIRTFSPTPAIDPTLEMVTDLEKTAGKNLTQRDEEGNIRTSPNPEIDPKLKLVTDLEKTAGKIPKEAMDVTQELVEEMSGVARVPSDNGTRQKFSSAVKIGTGAPAGHAR